MKKSLRFSLAGMMVFVMVFALTACGGGGNDGSSDTGVTTNTAPVANAGVDQSVSTGSTVTLDGSGCTDADGDTLTYSWSFTSKPAGSAAALVNATSVTPTFTADIDGAYVVSLTVNDGTEDSAADTVTVTAATAVVTDLSGYWNFSVTTDHSFTVYVSLSQTEDTLSGQWCDDSGTMTMSEFYGSVSGSDVEMIFSYTEGYNSGTVTWTGTIDSDGNSMSGTLIDTNPYCDYTPCDGTWSAVRLSEAPTCTDWIP